MSCWVVPAIAAEIWGMPLNQLMQRIGKGELPTKMEQGFMFVDVAPESPRYEPLATTLAERPATFTPITSDELQALTSETREDEEDEAREEDEPAAPSSKRDWRSVRQETARLRTPPPCLAAA